MADPALHSETNTTHHKTTPLKEIAIDYTPQLCTHCQETDEIAVTFDERGGSRWRSPVRYQYGTFSAEIQCPKGNTSGLNFNLYLSSLEGDKSQDEIDFEFIGKDKTVIQTNYYTTGGKSQDEIDFEFIGKDKTFIQTNYYTTGTGSREAVHDLGFDCSDGFHEYVIKWFPNVIEWLVDGKLIRRAERGTDCAFPEKPMFLYASVWDASYIADGSWTGCYVGCDAPYVCRYKNVHVPVETAVKE